LARAASGFRRKHCALALIVRSRLFPFGHSWDRLADADIVNIDVATFAITTRARRTPTDERARHGAAHRGSGSVSLDIISSRSSA
jgi:hypothetical protein